MTVMRGALVLENGLSFSGTLVGPMPSSASYSQNRAFGEVVFNTSMTGYQEILTDPSYLGQIVVMTAPEIGNTGVNATDAESARVHCAGLVIHELTQASSWRSESELLSYLEREQVPCLTGVSTRSLTKVIRSTGALRGVIVGADAVPDAQRLLATLPSFEGRDLLGEVSTKEAYRWPAVGQKQFQVAALDFGIKTNLLRELAARGCEVQVYPANTQSQEILAARPDGLFLSNGPGDPEAAPYAVRTVAECLGRLPIFGVCMGQQILGLALGAKTVKLKFGHRGGNHPVVVKGSGRVEISSHNHGYAVASETLPPTCEITHVNLNDGTLEGFAVPSLAAFAVQFHPEACPGPHDSVGLFTEFIELMRTWRNRVPKVS